MSIISALLLQDLELTKAKKQLDAHYFAVPPYYETFSSQKRKMGSEVNFNTLRGLSKQYDVARNCINKRKRLIDQLDWGIAAVDEKKEVKGNEVKIIRGIEDWFRKGLGTGRSLKYFIDTTMEDMLVLDGISIWRDITLGGKVIKYLPLDATTIRIKVNQDGSIPLSPNPAYEQWIFDKKVTEFSQDEMVYEMMNPRTDNPYGLSPLESLVLVVNGALKSQLMNLSALTEGNVPEGLYQMPKDWDLKRTQEFQNYFDSLIAGNPRFQNRIKFMPGGEGASYVPTRKPEEMRMKEYEQWLAIRTCSLFDLSPQDIGLTMDVNKATGEVQAQDITVKFGQIPTINLYENLFTNILRNDFGLEDFKFNFFGVDEKDELQSSEISERMIKVGALTINEWRKENGYDPVEGGDENLLWAGLGPIPLSDIGAASEIASSNEETETDEKTEPQTTEETDTDKVAFIKELRQFRSKIIKNFKEKGNANVKFASKFLEQEAINHINEKITKCQTLDEVRKEFDLAFSSIIFNRIKDESSSLQTVALQGI